MDAPGASGQRARTALVMIVPEGKAVVGDYVITPRGELLQIVSIVSAAVGLPSSEYYQRTSLQIANEINGATVGREKRDHERRQKRRRETVMGVRSPAPQHVNALNELFSEL